MCVSVGVFARTSTIGVVLLLSPTGEETINIPHANRGTREAVNLVLLCAPVGARRRKNAKHSEKCIANDSRVDYSCCCCGHATKGRASDAAISRKHVVLYPYPSQTRAHAQVYLRLFRWLVKTMNACTGPPPGEMESACSIGVVDTAGYENASEGSNVPISNAFALDDVSRRAPPKY